jgi:ParB-like chromosome segregation protein Spo0J
VITTESTKTASFEDLILDPEISSLMPQIDPGEYSRLEQNILADGCREAIVVESGTRIIIDGHQRYRICVEHHLPFEIVEKEFGSRIDAKIWIITNHLGRRNLSEFQRARLALALKPLLIARNRLRIVGGRATDEHTTTRLELARVAGVSRDTIQKVGLIMRNGSEEIIQALSCGSMSIRTASVLVGLPKKEQERVPDEPAAAILYSAERIRAQQKGEKIKRREDKLAAQRKTAKLKAHVIEADAVEWLHTIEDRSADLLFTDPPYCTDVPDIEAFVGSWLALPLSKVKATGRAYIFAGAYPEEMLAYLSALHQQKRFVTEILGWTYSNTLGPAPARGYKSNWQAVFYLQGEEAPNLKAPNLVEQFAMQAIPAPDGRQGERFGSWQKPYALAEMYIRHSSAEGDLIIDPFTGTGTLLLAAADLGRIAMGCDHDPEALAICRERGAEVCLRSDGQWSSSTVNAPEAT